MTDTKDLEGIDEIITRLCRIEEGINELRLATHQIFVALSRTDPTANINREDLEAIGETMVKKFGWPAINKIYIENGLKIITDTPAKTQVEVAAFLALQKTKGNAARLIKNLLSTKHP